MQALDQENKKPSWEGHIYILRTQIEGRVTVCEDTQGTYNRNLEF